MIPNMLSGNVSLQKMKLSVCHALKDVTNTILAR